MRENNRTTITRIMPKPTTQHTNMLKAQRTNENVSQMNDNKSGKKQKKME